MTDTVEKFRIEVMLREKMEFAILRPDMFGGWHIVEILLVEWAQIWFLVNKEEGDISAAEKVRLVHGEWMRHWTKQSKDPVSKVLLEKEKDFKLFNKAVRTAMADFHNRVFGE